MKTLFILLLIWLSFTIVLGFDNVRLQVAAENSKYRRALVIYHGFFAGCLYGTALFTGNLTTKYIECRDFSLKQKERYLK